MMMPDSSKRSAQHEREERYRQCEAPNLLFIGHVYVASQKPSRESEISLDPNLRS